MGAAGTTVTWGMPDRDPAGGAEVGGAGSGSTRFGRRQLLRGAAAGIAGAAALSTASAAGASEHGRRRARVTRPSGYGRTPPPAVSQVTLDSGVVVPVARWLVLENDKPGTIDWVVTGVQVPHAIEGYASQVSAKAGDEVTVFVNTTARSVSLQAFRMGYYQGLGGRLVYQSDSVPGQQQPASTLASGLNTVSCSWEPTLSFRVDGTWPPGCYLLKLQGDGGEQQYVPFTVRDDDSTSAFVIQNSVTTWQAYNLWDGYSLYYGKAAGGQNFTNRARVVSFDRPYPQTWAQGSADFLGNEFPLLYHLESLGADLTYWTDVDLHARPQLLVNHQCLFSLGHDEYWSLSMRNAALSALAKGTNLAFLGANACYRQIRLQESPVGPDRQQVCYKNAARGPDAGGERRGGHRSQLGVGPHHMAREQPHRQHVPVGAGQRRPGHHRRLFVGVRRLRPLRRPAPPPGGPGRVRPLRADHPRSAQRRRPRALAGGRPGQLVGHDLLHRPQRRRRAGHRDGVVREQAGQHDRLPLQRRPRRPSRA